MLLILALVGAGTVGYYAGGAISHAIEHSGRTVASAVRHPKKTLQRVTKTKRAPVATAQSVPKRRMIP